MSITDELREWAEDNTLRDRVLTTYPPQHAVHGVLETLLRIADRIDAEHQKCIDAMWEDAKSHLSDESLTEQGWIRLPKDADDEYIHIGDEVEWCDSGETLTVEGIGRDVLFYIDGENAEWTAARNKRHHHEPTVEDVLRECCYKYHSLLIDDMNDAINGVERDYIAPAEIIAEYAAKLRLAEGEDA